jgi:ABC-type branched-subunit amino acid transport system permease subunit
MCWTRSGEIMAMVLLGSMGNIFGPLCQRYLGV